MGQDYFNYGAIILLSVVAFIIIRWIKKKKEARKIEQKTAFLELQGYKRKLRRENAIKFLDSETLISLEVQTYSKDEAKIVIEMAEKQVKDGKFQELRELEDHKNRRAVWTGS